MLCVEMMLHATWATIKDNERTVGGFAWFGVHAADDIIGKCVLDLPLDVSLRGDRVSGSYQPYWHASVKQIVTYLGVLRKVAQPVGLDRNGGAGRVGDVRLDKYNIVKECHYIKEVPLCLSDEDNDVAESKEMVEQQHDVVLEGFDHSTGYVLLVPMHVLPFLVVLRNKRQQGSDTNSLFFLQLPDLKCSMSQGFKVIEGGVIPHP